MMKFKASKGCLMKSFTISMFLLLKGGEVTPSESLSGLYQSSLSPIPHADSSSLKKSTSVRYAAGNGLIWLNIVGKMAHIVPTPQQETDERGVKKSSTQPKPRSQVPSSSNKELQHKPSAFKKTSSNSNLISSKHTESGENVFEGYRRLRGKVPSRRAFPLHSSNRRYGRKFENDGDTNFKKKTLRDSHENRQVGLTDVLSNPKARRSAVLYSKEEAEDSGEHHMLEGLLDQYAPSLGTKQESLDEENTINKIEELTKLIAMAPTNPLDMRRNNFRDLDVSVGEMEPWEHKGYNGESSRRSRVAGVQKYVKQEEPLDMQGLRQSIHPFLLHERKARDALLDYFERFPKVSKPHRFPKRLQFNRAPPIERFPELPSITEQEHEIFPTSDLFLPVDEISDEYAENREPVAPEEDQPIDEPEPAPEPVPEPEPAPIPELPSIKEIPPIREPEAPAAPNLDPKKTFDTGASNGGEKKTLQTKEHNNVTLS